MSTTNEDLLAAAKAYRDKSYPFLPDNSTRQEEYAAAELAKLMDDAIAAAERELAERKLPIDDNARLLDERNRLIAFVKNIYSNFDCDEDGHKYNTYCRCCDAMKLLSGLGIEVKYDA